MASAGEDVHDLSFQGDDSRGGDERAEQLTNTDAPASTPRSSDFEMNQGQGRGQFHKHPDESVTGWRDRLRKAYLGAKSGQDRNDIAWAWACQHFGREKVQYPKVAALLKKAGRFDAYTRVVSRTAEMGEMEDPVEYAMGIIKREDQSTVKRGLFRTVAANGGNINDLFEDFDR